MQSYLDLLASVLETGVRKSGPDRHRHAVGLRPAAALRPRRRLPAGDDQEAAPEIHRARAALVPPRRHQRRLPARPGRHDLGRVGRRSGRPRARLRAPVALLGGRGRAHPRPAPRRARRTRPQPGQSPAHRVGLERRRPRPHGARALPLPVPVLHRAAGGRRAAPVAAALPALRRPVPRRAVQHRLLCAAARPRGPPLRLRARHLRACLRRRPYLPQPRRAGARAAVPHAPAPAAAAAGAGGRATCSPSPSTTSRSRTTRPGRPSRPRWPCRRA